MNLHSFIQYLKYRRIALGRHGMHSPFVYALVEDCIQRPDGRSLLKRIQSYLADWQQLAITVPSPEGWADWLDTEQKGFAPRQMILIPGIHQSPAHTRAWRQICRRQEIDYSIDLYDFGLLFRSPEFREKQHFVLKNK